MLVHAPAKLNLCLYLGPRREDGLHELCSLFEPLALADLIEISEAERDEVVCPGVEGENLAAAGACRRCARSGWEPPAAARRDREARSRSRPGWAAAAPTPPRSCALPPARSMTLPPLAAEIGADVPSQLLPSLALVRGRRRAGRAAARPGAHAVVLLPGGGGLSTAEVFAEADRLGLGREAAELEDLAGRVRARRGRRRLAALLHRPARQRPRARGPLAAARDRRRPRRAARRRRARSPCSPAPAPPPSASSPTSPPPARRPPHRSRRRDRLRRGKGSVKLPGARAEAQTSCALAIVAAR